MMYIPNKTLTFVSDFKLENVLMFNLKRITTTDYVHKKSLMVIGLTTSPEEFQSTFDHEKGHLAINIAKYYNIDPYSEDFQYLTGEIGKKLFPVAKKFICKHCNKDLKDLFSKNLGEKY